ncbi:hypothetical protein QJQ45_012489 [Haematococcus lacustris]|nr:hypothetical protein QJQ45_012489 [Haematococcus lacustris]
MQLGALDIAAVGRARLMRQWRCVPRQPALPCHQPHSLDLTTASRLLLLHESLKRGAGKCLVPDCSDLTQLPLALDQLGCCILLMEPEPRSQPHQHQLPAAQADLAQHCISYANAAARQVFDSLSSVGLPGHDQLGPDLQFEPHAGGQVAGRKLADIVAVLDPDCLPSPPPAASSPGLVYPARVIPPHGLPQHQVVTARLLAPSPPAALSAPQPGPLLTPPQALSHGLSLPAIQAGRPEPPALQQMQLTAQVLVCELASPSGRVVGFAWLWERWHWADGRMGRPHVPPLLPDQVPSETDLAHAEDGVRQQADSVRSLKTLGGASTNVLPAAVEELQRRKAEVAHIRRLMQAYDDSTSLLGME